MAERTLSYSPAVDIAATKIKDVVPEGVVRLYVYEMINADKDKAMFAELTTSFVQVANNTATFDKLEKDDNGNPYIEVLCDELMQYLAIRDGGDAAGGAKLRDVRSYDAISNQSFFNELDAIEFKQTRFLPIVATFIPIPKSTALDGKSFDGAAFLLSSFNAIQQAREYGMDPEGGYSVSISDIRLIEQSYSFSEIRLVVQDKFNIKEIFKLPVEPNRSISYKLTAALQFSTAGLLAENPLSLKASYSLGADVNTIKFKDTIIHTNFYPAYQTPGGNRYGFAPIKAVPVDLTDRLVLYSEGLDKTRVPYYDDDRNSGIFRYNKMEDFLLSLPHDPVNDTERGAVISAIYDCVLLTYLYRTSFRDLTPITDDTKVNYGKMTVWFNIGRGHYPITEVQGTTNIQMCDSIIKKAFTGLGNNARTGFQQLLTVMSKGIVSTHSIDNGSSTFFDIGNYGQGTSDLDMGVTFNNGTNKVPTDQSTGHVLFANGKGLEAPIPGHKLVDDGAIGQQSGMATRVLRGGEYALSTPSLPATLSSPVSRSLSNGSVSPSNPIDLGYLGYAPFQEKEDTDFTKYEMFIKDMRQQLNSVIFDKETGISARHLAPSLNENDIPAVIHLAPYGNDLKYVGNIYDVERITVSGIGLGDFIISVIDGNSIDNAVTRYKLPSIRHGNSDLYTVTQHNIILS